MTRENNAQVAKVSLLVKGIEKLILDFFHSPETRSPQDCYVIEVALVNLLAVEEIRRTVIARERGEVPPGKMTDYLERRLEWLFEKLVETTQVQLDKALNRKSGDESKH